MNRLIVSDTPRVTRTASQTMQRGVGWMRLFPRLHSNEDARWQAFAALEAQDMRVEHAMAVQDAHLKQQNTEADMHMRGMADERKYADAERARQFGAEREDAKAEHDDAALMEAIEAVRAEIAAMREQIGLPILNALNGSGSTALHGRV